jgi:hypothetical protein
MKAAVSILWPAFIVAGAAEVIFFTVIDPAELYLMGKQVELGPLAAYSIGFLLFWGMTVASSAFTWFLLLTADQINEDADARR